jgi:hypothetical protein
MIRMKVKRLKKGSVEEKESKEENENCEEKEDKEDNGEGKSMQRGKLRWRRKKAEDEKVKG